LHCLFAFTDPATTAIYTLSLHDALPILPAAAAAARADAVELFGVPLHPLTMSGTVDRIGALMRAGGRHQHVALNAAKVVALRDEDRKSTRLNSSHDQISYAVFCLKKKTR